MTIDRTLAEGWRFCPSDLDSEPIGCKATMKLAKEHPELLPKIAKLYKLSRFLIFSDEEVAKMKVTREEMVILERYGLVQKASGD